MLKAKKSDSVNIISNRIHRHLSISSLQSYRKSSKVKQRVMKLFYTVHIQHEVTDNNAVFSDVKNYK